MADSAQKHDQAAALRVLIVTESARAVYQAQLEAAGMSLDDLVKVTIFLSDRRWRAENAEVRREVLGPRSPALTIIITGIYDEAWLLEIEAVAAA